MGGADNIACQLILEDVGIQALQPGWRSRADVRIGLVAVQSNQFNTLPVQIKTAVRTEAGFTKSKSGRGGIDRSSVQQQDHFD